MEILLPSNDGAAVMKFCGFNHRVHYQGLNFPHLNTPIETFEQDATSVREKLKNNLVLTVSLYLH